MISRCVLYVYTRDADPRTARVEPDPDPGEVKVDPKTDPGSGQIQDIPIEERYFIWFYWSYFHVFFPCLRGSVVHLYKSLRT